MEIDRRVTCRLCTTNQIELVLNLHPIPLSENYSESREEALNQKRYALDIFQCLKCGHVQLVDIIDTALLWNSYSYYSKNSTGMTQHFEEIAEIIERLQIEKKRGKSLIVDIGSNDGSFLRIMQSKGNAVIGIDPAIDVANYAISNGVSTIVSVLNESVANEIVENNGQADVVTAFNVFAHTDDLDGFIRTIKKLLKPGGLFVFEAQYLRDILEQDLIATFFHEHMSHHSLMPLSDFLEANDLHLFHAERFQIQHGSIVGVCINGVSDLVRSDSLLKLIEDEFRLNINSIESMNSFRDRFRKNVIAVNEFLEIKRNEGFQIIGYGAARSAPTLIIQFELGNLIDFTVDDNQDKVGKYETGAGLKILSPKSIDNPSKTIAIVLAWVQLQKIVDSNADFLNQGGKFLVLSPKPHLITKEGVLALS